MGFGGTGLGGKWSFGVYKEKRRRRKDKEKDLPCLLEKEKVTPARNSQEEVQEND